MISELFETGSERRNACDNESVKIRRAELALCASPLPSREQLEVFQELMEHQRELEREQENEE
uniref:Uncharacterized protein n=1 Tax=Setaria digitata TaxID=48799 RepID=A0A915PIY1_9BILA